MGLLTAPEAFNWAGFTLWRANSPYVLFWFANFHAKVERADTLGPNQRMA